MAWYLLSHLEVDQNWVSLIATKSPSLSTNSFVGILIYLVKNPMQDVIIIVFALCYAEDKAPTKAYYATRESLWAILKPARCLMIYSYSINNSAQLVTRIGRSFVYNPSENNTVSDNFKMQSKKIYQNFFKALTTARTSSL